MSSVIVSFIQVHNAIQTNGSQSEWIDLGNLSTACITNPVACTDGGTLTAWMDCSYGFLISSSMRYHTGMSMTCTGIFLWVEFIFFEF